jgi:hypothetical protein
LAEGGVWSEPASGPRFPLMEGRSRESFPRSAYRHGPGGEDEALHRGLARDFPGATNREGDGNQRWSFSHAGEDDCACGCRTRCRTRGSQEHVGAGLTAQTADRLRFPSWHARLARCRPFSTSSRQPFGRSSRDGSSTGSAVDDVQVRWQSCAIAVASSMTRAVTGSGSGLPASQVIRRRIPAGSGQGLGKIDNAISMMGRCAEAQLQRSTTLR